jgi:hypothetical protein
MGAVVDNEEVRTGVALAPVALAAGAGNRLFTRDFEDELLVSAKTVLNVPEKPPFETSLTAADVSIQRDRVTFYRRTHGLGGYPNSWTISASWNGVVFTGWATHGSDEYRVASAVRDVIAPLWTADLTERERSTPGRPTVEITCSAPLRRCSTVRPPPRPGTRRRRDHHAPAAPGPLRVERNRRPARGGAEQPDRHRAGEGSPRPARLDPRRRGFRPAAPLRPLGAASPGRRRAGDRGRNAQPRRPPGRAAPAHSGNTGPRAPLPLHATRRGSPEGTMFEGAAIRARHAPRRIIGRIDLMQRVRRPEPLMRVPQPRGR